MTARQAGRQTARSADRVEEAEEIVKELRTALKNAGITLPTLRLDAASVAREAPSPLIELGRCNVETAALILAALR